MSAQQSFAGRASELLLIFQGRSNKATHVGLLCASIAYIYFKSKTNV